MSASSSIRFDADLVARYGLSGPRYTSYPTAPQFTDEITVEEYAAAAGAPVAAAGTTGAGATAATAAPGMPNRPSAQREGRAVSLYVHLPFCFSPCYYCGCNKVVTRDPARMERYVHHLKEESELRARCHEPNRLVDQLHLGGGTPTYLPAPQLDGLMESLGRHFRLSDGPTRDFSVEIDPRSVESDTLPRLQGHGFNRLSLGVKDFDPYVQQAVNRVQPREQVEQVYRVARGLKFDSINFDLIYGLPKQTLETFGRTLDEVIALRPDRLAIYGYAHLPLLFKAQRRISINDLPDAPTRLRLLQLAIEKLCAAGYSYIGLDHFALPTDGLARAKLEGTLHRSFQGYTTHANHDLVSLGVSAIGRVGGLYIQNHKRLADYERAIEQGTLPFQRGFRMDRDDHIRADLIQQIMCHGAVDIRALEARHGLDFSDYFGHERKRLQALERDGLVQATAASLRLTPAGQLLMRAVAMTFDAYLRTEAPGPIQSRVV